MLNAPLSPLLTILGLRRWWRPSTTCVSGRIHDHPSLEGDGEGYGWQGKEERRQRQKGWGEKRRRKDFDEILAAKKSKFPNHRIRKMPLLLSTPCYNTEHVTLHLVAASISEAAAGWVEWRTAERRGGVMWGAATHFCGQVQRGGVLWVSETRIQEAMCCNNACWSIP